ncbi:VIT family protein, partial [Salmonella enterica subsp. enterica serovar Newport]|nr:VIT family protein [Salmonella enterica subsp. enterica serovar Newport]
QAALSSALAFVTGAIAPVVLAALAPTAYAIPVIGIGCLIALFLLGIVGAVAGGADPWRPAIRVVFWGAVAMAVTALIGKLVGAAL